MAKLFFYYSAMNAGKSTNLLQSSHNYRERGMDTLLYTPSIDDRFEHGKIHSRIGLDQDATVFNREFNFYDAVNGALATSNGHLACVLIDEAQFLTKGQVHQLTEIADKLHVPVLAYGLRSDFQGELFEGSQYLLAWAEELIEVKTICHCGRKATHNMRIDGEGNKMLDGEQIQIGGNESYISTCRRHFKSGHSGQQKKAA